MFKKALALDSKLFLKEKRIQAKRPSEYWLEFLKKHVLIEQKAGFSWTLLLFLIPFFLLIFIIVNISSGNGDGENYGNWFIGLFVLTVFTLVIVGGLSTLRKRAFVNPNTFDHLAKFIVKIKGDTYKNLIGIRLNLSPIENEANLVPAKQLGLRETRQTKYAPYQLERYQANLRLKDDSFCSASLFQISLKTTTTKRRSSGKTKTKSKHKHKLYFILSLKISTADYQVTNPHTLKGLLDIYEVSVKTENGFHIVKIKFKEKLPAMPLKITNAQKRKPSIYINMIEYLFRHKIIRANTNTLLIS
ncbi:MAG: hypothetical protein AB8B59_15445 [Maribacter sp.]